MVIYFCCYLKIRIFFSWPFFSEYFCWDAFVFEVLLDESSYLQTFFFSIHSGNGMTKNTPKVIPGSWDYFFPFSFFLTPLISITSLAVLWWWQAGLLPSAALLFSIDTFLILLKEADAPATSKEDPQGLMLFDQMDASSRSFGIDICCQNRFFKWFLCHLVPDFLLHSGNVRFNVAFRITFSWKSVQ